MPDLFDLMWQWRKQILVLVISTLIVTTVIVFLIPKKYLGETTALPAPNYATDKTGVFGQNLQNLYSALGTPDDLDRVVGTARLDTVYKAAAGQLDLAEHYGIRKDNASLQKAARYLKKRTRVIKTDYGELQVKVWDADRGVAAGAANAIMEKLQQIHQDIQSAHNKMMLLKISEAYAEKKLDYQRLQDSLQGAHTAAATDLLNVQKVSLLQQMQDYEKLSGQYKLMVEARPQALIIIERAYPALKPDRPRALQIIIAATVLSLLFAVLASLVLERKRLIGK